MSLRATIPALALCALATSCSRKADQPVPVAATSMPAAEIGDSVAGGVGTPVNGASATATQTSVGAAANGAFGGSATVETAAVTPLANANGTVPASPGVGPAGGGAFAANTASAGGTGVAAATQTARSATSAGVTASGRVTNPVAPVGGVRGPSVTSGAVTSGGPASTAPVAAAPVAAAPAVAAGSVASGAVAGGAPR